MGVGMSKQTVLLLILALVVLSVAPFLSIKANPSSNDWPMFHHDFMHSGYSASTAPDTNATLWTYKTGGGVNSSPAVVDGRVYVGSEDNNVYCLDAFNGDALWNYTTGDTVGSSSAVADGKVYVGSDSMRNLENWSVLSIILVSS
jgi:hypothetical protein